MRGRRPECYGWRTFREIKSASLLRPKEEKGPAFPETLFCWRRELEKRICRGIKGEGDKRGGKGKRGLDPAAIARKRELQPATVY